MVALVKGDSFCVKSDRLLEVARLARRVALSHLRQHRVNLGRHVFFSKPSWQSLSSTLSAKTC